MDYTELSLYNYRLPSERIAQRPAVPRDSAKMLVYRKELQAEDHVLDIEDSVFSRLPDYLNDTYVLVCNDTKVIPARIRGKRATGGVVEFLFVEHLSGGRYKTMLSRFIRSGEELTLEGGLKATVVDQAEKYFFVQVPVGHIDFIKYLNAHGTMPVPPYIDHPDSRSKLLKEYQTVFAKHEGSVAAPTASLHFTERLLSRLKKAGVSTEYITLHVGLGTFAPLTEENFKTNTLHSEWYEMSDKTHAALALAHKKGKKIIAVGTTVLRVLETVAQSGVLSGSTDIFITPPHRFVSADGMITNFHLPQTSLLLLISAFIGDRKKTLEVYDHAIRQHYRFYSFGDGMLIL